MSLLDLGIEQGYVELDKQNGILVIYPRRVMRSEILLHLLSEINQSNDFDVPDTIEFNHPIILKRKKTIDMTEVFIKLYALSKRYGIEFVVKTNLDPNFSNDTITFMFSLGEEDEVVRRFDANMLASMEKDYILEWFESILQEYAEAQGVKQDGENEANSEKR